jgi:hypothetical protein
MNDIESISTNALVTRIDVSNDQSVGRTIDGSNHVNMSLGVLPTVNVKKKVETIEQV